MESAQGFRFTDDPMDLTTGRAPAMAATPHKLKDWQDVSMDRERRPTIDRRPSSRHDTASLASTQKHSEKEGMFASRAADFFSPEIFQIVLHNPTTSHQLLKFSQSRFCGENMEFLEKVDRYNTLLDELTKTMSEIYRSFTSPDSPRQLNISQAMMKRMNMDIKATTTMTLPGMELIFADAQQNIENILATDIYPRFVKHQMTVSAEKALSIGRGKYGGLGDCFCLTDPAKADNPIVYASDGFIKVTGYSRTDIIPRNCRFLQGKYTDQSASRRLKEAIERNQESVELLLNYRSTGEPFWNLLYVAPLFDAEGKVKFFLGGQINCSTTIHNRGDILRVLSMSDEAEEEIDTEIVPPTPTGNLKKGFFSSFRKRNGADASRKQQPQEDRDAGMEQQLLNRIEKMNFKNQMKMFYTAYSKYIVLSYEGLNIEFSSAGVFEMLLIDPKVNNLFLGNEIFRVLIQYAPNMPKDFKSRIKNSLRMGRAMSADIDLATRRSLMMRRNEKFATHWTPLKDEHGIVKHVIVTLAPINED